MFLALKRYGEASSAKVAGMGVPVRTGTGHGVHAGGDI